MFENKLCFLNIFISNESQVVRQSDASMFNFLQIKTNWFRVSFAFLSYIFFLKINDRNFLTLVLFRNMFSTDIKRFGLVYFGLVCLQTSHKSTPIFGDYIITKYQNAAY